MFHRQRRLFVASLVSVTTTWSTSRGVVHSFTPTVTRLSFLSTRITTRNSRFLSTIMSATTTTPTSTTSNEGGSTSQPQQRLFLFDFDGVVCDSCDECTVSALRTLHQLKKKKKDKSSSSSSSLGQEEEEELPLYPPDWLFDKMRAIRPAIEIGWQIPVLLSIFWNQYSKKQQDPEATILSVDDIITNYEVLVNDWLTRNQLTDKDMISTFGTVRDDWIETDLESWLTINTFYKGIPDSINNCIGKSILVTTKQQRFAIELCRHANITSQSLPNELIYGLGQYKSKTDVIVDQMKMKQEQGEQYLPSNTYFFEDRWPTLVKCLKDDRLHNVNLYLCSWGYVTSEELALAHAEPRVKVLELNDFVQLVQHGVNET